MAFYYHLVERNEEQAIIWYGKSAENSKQAEQMLKRINTPKNKSLQSPIKLDDKEERGGHNLPNDRRRMEDLSAKIIQSVFAGRDQEAKRYAAQGLAALRSTKRQNAPYPLRSKQVQKSSVPTVAVRSVSQEKGDAFAQAEEIMKQGKCCLVLGQYKTARKLFEQIAGPDCPQAYLYLGKIYRMGFGVPRNVEQSNIYYQNAQAVMSLFEQDPDNPRKRFYVGIYHNDVTKNHKQAAEHFSFADIHGDADATYLLALCYLVDTLGVKKNLKKAVELLQKAIVGGHPNARYELAMYYNIKEPKKAEEEFRKGIALQDPMSSCGLVVLYLKRTTKDLKKIAELFEAAAKQGDAIAQYYTGECYLKGHGVAEDISTAIKWFTPAAEQGHAKVQFELGKIHLRSIGDKKPDYEEAIKWLKLAAVQGHDEASFELGMIYFERTDGGEPDYTEAKKWFELAAKYGSIEAPLYLQKCQAKINALGRDQTKSEDKTTEAKGSFPDSSVQLVGQVKPESPSFSSGAGFLLSPVGLSPQQVENFLSQMVQSNVEKTPDPGPKGLSLRMFSSSSGSSNGAAPNCMDKFIIGNGQQAKPESNEAVVQSSVTAKTNSAQSSASNGSTGFFKQGKKSKGQKKSSGVLPQIRNNGSRL